MLREAVFCSVIEYIFVKIGHRQWRPCYIHMYVLHLILSHHFSGRRLFRLSFLFCHKTCIFCSHFMSLRHFSGDRLWRLSFLCLGLQALFATRFSKVHIGLEGTLGRKPIPFGPPIPSEPLRRTLVHLGPFGTPHSVGNLCIPFGPPIPLEPHSVGPFGSIPEKMFLRRTF